MVKELRTKKTDDFFSGIETIPADLYVSKIWF